MAANRRAIFGLATILVLTVASAAAVKVRADEPKPPRRWALLVGVDRKLPYFEAKASEDPAWMLLVVALKREMTIKPANSAKIKTALMKRAWRPEFYLGAPK